MRSFSFSLSNSVRRRAAAAERRKRTFASAGETRRGTTGGRGGTEGGSGTNFGAGAQIPVRRSFLYRFSLRRSASENDASCAAFRSASFCLLESSHLVNSASARASSSSSFSLAFTLSCSFLCATAFSIVVCSLTSDSNLVLFSAATTIPLTSPGLSALVKNLNSSVDPCGGAPTNWDGALKNSSTLSTLVPGYTFLLITISPVSFHPKVPTGRAA